MRTVRRSGLTAGEAAFEQQLADIAHRAGPNSIDVVDALSGFGLALFMEDDAKANMASLTYLHRSADVARKVYDGDRRELAVELHGYAVAVRGIGDASRYDGAVAAIREAYAIRIAALGDTDISTLNALGTLASLLSSPTYAAQTPTACSEASLLADSLLAELDRNGEAFGEERILMYGEAAETYGQCGDVEKTFAVADKVAGLRANDPNLALFTFTRAANALEAADKPDQARKMRMRHPGLEAQATAGS